jgi:hypothetical protein
MVNSRRVVQEAHERFQVGLLLGELNRRHRSSYRVIAEPNPPEAIIRSGRRESWVEVVTAFWSDEFAKDVWTYATPGEEHAPMAGPVHVGPDAAFSARFARAVRAKLEKSTYKPAFDKYGAGYLVVAIQYPLFNGQTMRFMREAWAASDVSDRGYFRSIYLTYRVFSGYRVTRWKP